MKTQSWDIPINFTVQASSEYEAERSVRSVLNQMIYKYGLENVIEYKDFEFIAPEPCDSGCRDNHHEQRECTHTCKSTCDNPTKTEGQSCCNPNQGELF